MDDNFLWNAGIFLFRAQDMIGAFKSYAEETLDLVSRAVNDASVDLGFLRLAAEPWSDLNKISIDFAIMEKAPNIIAVPYNSKWSDLGGWDAVLSEIKADSDGNVTSQTAHAIECTNTLLRSENSSQQLVGIGLDDIIAVAMPDAVLVASNERAQDVKKAVELSSQSKLPKQRYFLKIIGHGDGLRALHWELLSSKALCKTRTSLSLQSHEYRSEHWIIVKGMAKSPSTV